MSINFLKSNPFNLGKKAVEAKFSAHSDSSNLSDPSISSNPSTRPALSDPSVPSFAKSDTYNFNACKTDLKTLKIYQELNAISEEIERCRLRNC